MILVCHDLMVFNPRGEKTTKQKSKIDSRNSFVNMVKDKKPTIVFHPYHLANSSKIWTASWNKLLDRSKSIEYYGAGNLCEDVDAKMEGIKILEKTKNGGTIDLLVSPKNLR